ncbi:short-chain fatty acid transporter [Acetonema longum]|uniref:Short chain fatty acid transporter n=1 Tax=Acetonema longum DSM 6540 TaxID=1009370 RepID=F7NMT4_9FIRM|nr:TIGR00366 family protein [Acetonema longum]EGO62628.1 short chain fatty acid transporter [Acetonema longum DSM 6540]
MLHKLARFFVTLVQKYLPDAYLFAILLTFGAFILAWGLTGKSAYDLVYMWGSGLYGILAFAMQMILILVTGHSLASSKPIKAALRTMASIPKNTEQAAMLAVFVAAMANFVNWGFGLVVGALFARELARQVKGVDYPFLVAAGYSGFVVWHGGISGSIPLAVATKGHIVENLTGIIPVSQTVFSSWNLIITFAMIFTLPILFKLMAPRPEEAIVVDPALFTEAEEETAPIGPQTFATRLENSVIINGLLGLMGLVYLFAHFSQNGFDLNLNIVIFIFFIAGVILHKTPINYVKAMNEAIKGAGGIALQFPLYGGIQGIMVSSGLAAIIAKWFISFSTVHTFPLFTFIAGGVINFFVPSGGGQWIVQGPINIPAGLALGVEPAKVAMGISYGDQWTNMIQPFWALPLLGIAKLGVRDIMGYCVLTLLWSGIIIALGLLVL